MEELDVEKETTDQYTLRGRVFNQIREAILFGQYKSGEELRESAIAHELGVSRTPVREALRQLELEGLVKIIPNKGAQVISLSVKDIKDIYAIRSHLEGLCTRWACEHITKEQIEDLEEIVYLSDFHAMKNHYEQMLDLDNKFHDIIYEASESKMLRHLLKDFHHYVQRVRKITLSSPERAIQSNKEHEAILDALKEHNPDKAEELAHKHMLCTVANIEKKGLEKMLNS